MISAENLHVHFSKSHILKGIDIKIQKGEVVGLVGRNGMGKSTLLRTLAGLVCVSEGSIRIKGQDCTNIAPYKIARMGIAYVPEKRGIFPNLSVKENLVMAARPRVNGELLWNLDAVLRKFPKLRARLKNGGFELSGGEQQMLTIARALLTNPDYILLDEATEGLAPMIAKEIWKTVGEFALENIGAIVVDRNLDELSRVANRIIVIVKGQVVYNGSPKNLQEDEDMRKDFLGV